mmetsp:Transcript_6484/g.21279  ORF Transcript_6484/g.21279 Transcript_6484/m.21279 type:complete len:254 (+) Transcript_6484:9486-10247(+)
MPRDMSGASASMMTSFDHPVASRSARSTPRAMSSLSRGAPTPEPEPESNRSFDLITFPSDVFGSASTNITSCGTLNRARRAAMKSINVWASTRGETSRTTTAQRGISPMSASGAANTAHSTTSGCSSTTRSTSLPYTVSPPTCMTSLTRSTMRNDPLAFTAATSPVRCHSSTSKSSRSRTTVGPRTMTSPDSVSSNATDCIDEKSFTTATSKSGIDHPARLRDSTSSSASASASTSATRRSVEHIFPHASVHP